MAKAFVKIGYRQLIDTSCKDDFSTTVLRLTHREFQLKCQAYNPGNKFTTFTQMKANDGRANSLHYKTGFAIAGLSATLEHKMPGITNSLGNQILFDNYELKVIESHIHDIQKHVVAITYFTDVCTLHEIIGEYLLLSYSDSVAASAGLYNTFLLKIQSNLSVVNYREVTLFENKEDISASISN